VRVDASAVGGVLRRNYAVFLRTWRSNTVISVVDPVISLLAFGFGFGALVAKVGNIGYVEYVGTGIVAQTVLFTTIFPGMFETFFKRDYQHTYDALLAAPVDAIDVVTAEALWIGIRSGVFGCAPMLVAMVFGLDPSFGMLLVPFIGFLAGFGWANFGIGIAARMNSIDNFSYVISAVLTPLFLFAGTFFPISGLPEWAQVLAQCNPLYHLVQLVRDAVFGNWSWDDLGHLAVLLAFGTLTWRLAVRWMERRLVV
jgi:lipooligosaccharide transport system permease protein